MAGTTLLNILHIEDSNIDAKILQKLISNNINKDFKYTITLAQTLKEAMSPFNQEFNYDVILLDLSLPDGKGIQNIKTLKSIYPSTPIIVVSGSYDKTLSEQALLNGAQEYIAKEHNSSFIIDRVIQSSIFRKKKETDLTHRAYNDDLTGLPNKAFFEHTVRKMLTRAQRIKRKEALIFIDLNLFKEINDTYGHEAGNQVLVEVSKRLQSTLRFSDLIARYAGDEFVIYMDSGKEAVTEEVCHHVANKIVKEIEKPIKLNNKQSVAISLSIGIAIFPDAGQTYDILLNKADEAMYKAKKSTKQKYTIINSCNNKQSNPSQKNLIKAANKNTPQQIILIIDDCEKDRKKYKKIIHNSYDNYKVIEAKSIHQAERLLQNLTPDCILLDNNLPDGTGLDFLKNKTLLNRKIKFAIVMITQDEDYNIAVQAFKFGSKDYIAKSNINNHNLCLSIDNAINTLRIEKDLEQFQSDLQRSNDELESFTNILVHDLKSPIQKISMFCDLISENNNDGHNQRTDIQDYVERMSINSYRAETLINDLLTYSKIDSTKHKKEWLCINTITSKIVTQMHKWLCDNDSSVVIEELPTIHAYPFQTEQLIINLITNAVKFRNPNKKNIIKISSYTKNNHETIQIEDNGIGIAYNYQEKIFLPFQKLHSADEIEGSGLGLSICKKIVQNHGGNITVKSEVGKGSIFTFTMNERTAGKSPGTMSLSEIN